MFDIIVATDNKDGIGKNNTIPWKISDDFRHFRNITLHSYIIMGRNTWNSLPKKPLPNRTNIIISSTTNLQVNESSYIIRYNPLVISCNSNSVIYVFTSLDLALSCIYNSKCDGQKNTFVIGGQQLYEEAINHDECNKIYQTKIYKTFDCDTFFPKLPNTFNLVDVSKFKLEGDIHFRYYTYQKNVYSHRFTNQEETNYIQLLRNILGYGEKKSNRTGVNTFSLFGKQLEYDLSDTFPILTTRKQFFRGIFEELLFYLRGYTNNNKLVEKGVNVWTGNTTREFLDSRNLDYEEGDMGPTYGFNFRNFGGKYVSCNTEHSTGHDQLSELIHTLKTDRDSRRMIITLWDPINNKKSALPSCMCFYQFYVSNKTNLDLQVYIRSSDYFLANNWNTCTAALFVHLLCNVDGIDLKPGTLSVVMGDVHVYENQLEGIKQSLTRKPKPFPKLVVSGKKDCITDFSFDDVKLIGYDAEPKIKVDMVV